MTPGLPELTRRQAERVLEECCDARVPLPSRSQVRLAVDVRGNIVTVIEEWAPWKPEYGPLSRLIEYSEQRESVGARRSPGTDAFAPGGIATEGSHE